MEKGHFLGRFLVSIVLLTFCIGLYASSFSVCASEQTEQPSLRNQYVDTILVSVNNQPCSEYEYVTGMNVSDNGSFLVVLRSRTFYYVDIYDNELEFQNQLMLSSTGSVYISFGQRDDELVIYFPKEQTMFNVKTSGEYLSASTQEPVPEILIDRFVNDYEKTINSYCYSLQTNKNTRTALVESKEGSIVCQYSSTWNNPTWHVLLIMLLTFSVIYICLKNNKKFMSQDRVNLRES